jgi:predicted amidohydrolase
METLTAALWAINLEPPATTLATWVASVEARMADAQAAGARLLVLPEFACAQWLSFAPARLPVNQQVSWLASLTGDALAALRQLPARYDVALLPGTMPFAVSSHQEGAPRHLNRAWLLLPDGRAFTQDKLCLTPQRTGPGRMAPHPRGHGQCHPVGRPADRHRRVPGRGIHCTVGAPGKARPRPCSGAGQDRHAVRLLPRLRLRQG